MLRDILKEISVAKTFSIPTIAKNLNTSEALVEEGIDQLSRMGYLIEDMGSPTCETKCSGCMISNCNTIPLKTLTITKKGEQLLNSTI